MNYLCLNFNLANVLHLINSIASHSSLVLSNLHKGPNKVACMVLVRGDLLDVIGYPAFIKSGFRMLPTTSLSPSEGGTFDSNIDLSTGQEK